MELSRGTDLHPRSCSYGGNTPWPSLVHSPYPLVMNTDRKERVLTLGEFIMGVYATCDEHKAGTIVWLAIHTGLVTRQMQDSWLV